MTIFNGKIHYKWPFSIAMLNYQRVYCNTGIKATKHGGLQLMISAGHPAMFMGSPSCNGTTSTHRIHVIWCAMDPIHIPQSC